MATHLFASLFSADSMDNASQVSVCTRVWVRAQCARARASVCVHVCVSVCISMCIGVCVMCVFVCKRVCLYVCTCVWEIRAHVCVQYNLSIDPSIREQPIHPHSHSFTHPTGHQCSARQPKTETPHSKHPGIASSYSVQTDPIFQGAPPVPPCRTTYPSRYSHIFHCALSNPV